MPKDKRSCTFANKSHECFYNPYSRGNNKSGSNTKEEAAEWDDVTCPICMESPHNAVLLLCSSNDKGCRPFMCDTSYRHSNCLDQYIKAQVKAEADSTTEAQPTAMETETGISTGNVAVTDDLRSVKTCKGLELACPLCRGKVLGWQVLEKVRQQLNMSKRGCAHESCYFVGTYDELRKHARYVHPFARPSEIDPARQREWWRMERQRDLGDVFSSIQSAMPGATIMGDYVIEEGDEEDERDDEDEESEEDGFAEENVEIQQPDMTVAQTDLWTMLVLFQIPGGGPLPPAMPFISDPLRQNSGNTAGRVAGSPRVSGGSRSVFNPTAGRTPSLSSGNFDIRRLPEIFEAGASRRLPEVFEASASRRLPEVIEGGASSSRALERSSGHNGSSSRGSASSNSRGSATSNSRGSSEWNSYLASRGSLERNNSHHTRTNVSSGRRRGSSDRSTQERNISGRSTQEMDYLRRHAPERSREELSQDHFLRRREQSSRSSSGERGRGESTSDYFLRRHGNSGSSRSSRR